MIDLAGMPDLLAEILAVVELWFTVGFAVFLRVGAAFATLPGFGESYLPMRVRLAGALAFTLILAPILAPSLASDLADLPFLRLVATETISGLLIGIGLRIIVFALQIAGTMAAQATSLSQIMGGAQPEAQPAMAAFLVLAGLALAVLSGLHLHMIEAFLRSYEVLPAGTLPLARDAGQWGVARVAAAFSLGFSLAAPFLVASLLYNLALGVINKAMPQLMVAMVGAPAITWGGLALLLVTTPFLLPIWFHAFQAGLAQPLGLP